MSSMWSAPAEGLKAQYQLEWIEAMQVEAHLRLAEKDIRWLRNVGLAGWFVVLWNHGYQFGFTPVWGVYLAGVTYGAWAHFNAARTPNIRRAALITTFADPILAAMICLVTGGIKSVLYPFFYFTQMSVAIRFGVRESVLIACFNTLLMVIIFFVEPLYSGAPGGSTPLVLGTAIFLLLFSGYMGATLAKWAREYVRLILEHARKLREAGDRYQAVLRRLAQVQEEERRNISGELHDRMSGHLFFLRQGIEQCMGPGLDQQRLEGMLVELSATVRACTHDVRSIMNQLRPTVLDELGFVEAASEFLARQSELSPFRLIQSIDPALRDWRSRQDAMLFRLLQEALLNVQKHAEASLVEVSLERQSDEVVLRVLDDGKGFDLEQVPVGHYGLMTMRERAEAVGGRLHVRSGKGGTLIEVHVPVA